MPDVETVIRSAKEWLTYCGIQAYSRAPFDVSDVAALLAEMTRLRQVEAEVLDANRKGYFCLPTAPNGRVRAEEFPAIAAAAKAAQKEVEK